MAESVQNEDDKTVKELRKKLEELERRVKELEEENRRLREEKGPGGEEVLFHIDTDPSPGEREERRIRYEARTEGTMTEHETDKNDKSRSGSPSSSKVIRGGNSCFNCGGDHMIADCPKPKDFAAIAKRRREFQKSQAAANSSARYHLDEPQRFAHLRPGGRPSERLRRALGMREGELAPYVYRMRELGYPPGWLREAEVRHSGVALYLADGRALQDQGEEEGETREEEEKVRYDLDRLVRWPGFNAPVPEDCRDEAEASRRTDGWPPPMRREHSVDAMMESLGDKAHTGYVRGEMQDTTTTSGETTPAASRKRRMSCEEDGETSDKKKRRDLSLADALRSDEVRAVSEGTPIVTLHSPYESLPSQSAWAKDTTDHILFENLPDSTGKWDDMLKVIKRGREMRSKIDEDGKQEKNL